MLYITVLASFLFAFASIALASQPYLFHHTCPVCTSSPDNCHRSAPCSFFVYHLYCGCKPGYKATGVPNHDTKKQWRIDRVPGHEHRVWVAPGVKCETPCNPPSPPGSVLCGEVAVRDECFH